MDQSVNLARHFARLVWLLLREPANIDEQKGLVRALVMVAKEGETSLETAAGQLTANGHVIPAVLSGVPEVAERMTAQGISRIAMGAGASAADLLGAARALAGASSTAPSPAPDASVRFITRGALPNIDFGEVLEIPPPPLPPPPRVSAPSISPPRSSQDTSKGADTPTTRADGDGGASVDAGSRGGMVDHFSPARLASATPPELLARLDATQNPDELDAVLDALARIGEDAARDAKPAVASEIFYRIVRRERDVREPGVKRAFVLTVKRLAKPAMLRSLVAEMARGPERREEYLAVLVRTGEDAADTLIEQLVEASAPSERRMYFNVLSRLQAGVPTLLHMLGDERWDVARNAAALLGEMQAPAAEKPLSDLLHHDDERVRHAATISLMRLGTPRSMQTIQEAFKDQAPQIRMQAAAALVARTDVKTAALLLQALDQEKDEEVAAAFLIALGRLATGDAVDRLIATAEADRGMFRKRPVALRVAAVQGLAEARTPEAIMALKELQHDKDEDVQASAVYALGRTARRSEARPAQ
jgi:HEAT repeat protein